MNKYAAEKIASDYYNMGVQLALQNAGLVKTARAGKITAALAALGMSPAALNEAGLLASQTGVSQAGALKSLLAGEGANALGFLKGMGGAAKSDLAALKGGLFGRMPTAAEVEGFAQNLPTASL